VTRVLGGAHTRAAAAAPATSMTRIIDLAVNGHFSADSRQGTSALLFRGHESARKSYLRDGRSISATNATKRSGYTMKDLR